MSQPSTRGTHILKTRRSLAWIVAGAVSLLVVVAAAFMWKKHVQSARIEKTLARRAALDRETQRKICAHRSNSIAMYREALRSFDCIEMDIHLDPPGGGPAAIYHPPAENNHGLTLEFLLSHERLPAGNLWLDVKDLSAKNWARFLGRLVELIPQQRRRDIIVETVWSGRGVRPAIEAFRGSGFNISYYVPTEEAISCGGAQSPSCDALRQQVLLTVSMGFSHMSFDARAYPFVKSIRGKLPRTVRLLTWDLRKSWPQPDLIGDVEVYIVNFPSPYSDAHR